MLSLKLQTYKQFETLVFKLEYLNIPIVIYKKDLQIQFSEADSKIVDKLHKNIFDKNFKIRVDIRFKRRFKGSELIQKYKEKRRLRVYLKHNK